MAENNQDMQQQDSDTLWEIVSDVIDRLQFSNEKASSSAELVQKLLKVDQLPGISKEELSIVYCEYGTQDYKLIVYAGNEVNGDNSPADTFDAKNQAIQDVAINSLTADEYPWFKTKTDCTNAGFDGFGTVMIVPMRLGRHRRLGAFIIHSKEANAYSKCHQRVMDVLSDRLAALIRSLRRRLRDELAYKLRNELLGRLTSSQRMFEGECEILGKVLEHLKTWYERDHIHILIKNPLDIKTYYQATDEEGNIRPGFRTTTALEREALLQIIGGEDNFKAMTALPSDSSETPADALHGRIIYDFAELPNIHKDCKSWLGVTMHHPDGYVFGHIVLHDTEMPYAYDNDDLRSMDAIADFLGFLLAEYRTKQKKAVIRELASLPLNDPQQLYSKAAEYLRRLYGVKHFQIRAVNFSSQEWELVWPENAITQAKLKTDNIQNEITHFANKHRFRQGYGNPPLELQLDGKNHLVTPMRAGISRERVIGAFVIPANEPGKIASHVIDEVSDALGDRLNSRHRQNRYEALTIFVNKVSSLPSTDLTQEQVLQIAHKHISKVMFSENVYIALYDEAEDTISFPLIYRNGKVWEEMHNQTRKFNPAQLGRTEVIIRDKKSLLFKTKKESEAWYNQPPHNDHARNPLASWVGVPIFAASEEKKKTVCDFIPAYHDDLDKEKKVRGVIAAYHDDLDYVYSIRDLFFLYNVAGAVAGLFRVLENRELEESNRKLEDAIANNSDLKKSNRKLGEAFEVIKNNEKSLEYAINILLQDVSFRINSNLGLAKSNVIQAVVDVDHACRTGDVSTLPFTLDGLRKSELSIVQIVNDIRMIAAPTYSKFALDDLIKTIVRQIKSYKKIQSNLIFKDNGFVIESHYRTLLNALYSIFDDLLPKLAAFGVEDVIVNLEHTKENTDLIELKYNSSYPELNENELDAVPDNNTMPYWRAYNILKSINGDFFVKNIDDSSKAIQIKLMPKVYEKNISRNEPATALVYDPEGGSLIFRWMIHEGYQAYSLKSIEEIIEYKNSLPLILLNIDTIWDSQKMTVLKFCLDSVKFKRLFLLFEESPKNYHELECYNPVLLRKYDDNLNFISRENFLMTIGSVED